MLKLDLEVQQAENFEGLPSEKVLSSWAEAALAKSSFAWLGVVLRFVDLLEGQELNRYYRDKDYATNVLSFEFDWPEEVTKPEEEPDYLGDLVICVPIVKQEAQEQNKDFAQHLAHLVIHGMLHLQGFDHLSEAEALEMENLEVSIMQSLGFVNPYL